MFRIVLLVLALLPFLLGIMARRSYAYRPRPRREHLESNDVGRTMLLGTYRWQGYLLWLRVPLAVWVLAVQSVPMMLVDLAFLITYLVVTRALYYRLGYRKELPALVVGHLALLFAFLEREKLQEDVHAFLQLGQEKT